MARFSVPVTILTTITVDAPDADGAAREAARFAEGMCEGAGDHFRDGWNDVQRQNGAPTICSLGGIDIEDIAPDEVQEVAACRTEDCDGDPDNGEGYDGYCGTCADASLPDLG